MAFGVILLAGYSRQSRAGKMAPSCPLRQPITARDLVHLARSPSQPYNKTDYCFAFKFLRRRADGTHLSNFRVKSPISNSPVVQTKPQSTARWSRRTTVNKFICIIPVQTIHKLYIVVCKVMQLLVPSQPPDYMLFIPAVPTAFATINSSYSLRSPALLNAARLFQTGEGETKQEGVNCDPSKSKKYLLVQFNSIQFNSVINRGRVVQTFIKLTQGQREF